MTVTGNPDFGIIKRDDINHASFMAGAKRAVEEVSKRLSRRDIGGLNDLVSTQCLDDIRTNILEKLPMEQYPDIPVQAKDVFFHFIHSLKVIDGDTVRISTITYSIPGLDQSKQVWEQYKRLKNDIHHHASKNKGILQKGDINSREMRRKLQAYDDFGIPQVLKGNEIITTYYTFEKTGSSNWKVIRFSHADTGKIWNNIRRQLWKGRLHLVVNEEMKFEKYLRIENIIVFFSILFGIYLQYLALKIGRKYEEQHRQQEEDDFAPIIPYPTQRRS